MYKPRRPIHVLLECSVKVWVSLGRRSETHLLAKVVTTIATLRARTAESTSFDGHTVTNCEGEGRGDVGTESYDLTGRLVTETHGVLECEITVATVKVVVEIGTTETSGTDSNLDFIAGGSRVGTLFDLEILGTVEDGRSVGSE